MKHLFELVNTDFDPIKSFRIKSELNPKIWDKFDLDSDVRDKLVKIAEDFYDSVDLPTDVVDIVLCGSLCNYNWSERYSDYDLHIIIDFSNIKAHYDLVSKLCDYAKKTWNKSHDIKILGYDVEIAIQDKEDLSDSIESGRMGGVFSLLNNRWIKRPDKKEFVPDESLIKEKSKSIMMTIDDIESELGEDKSISTLSKIDKVWKKIKKFRKSGLDTESGEYSVGNLVFKLLRRNGYIDKILNLKLKAYDEQFLESNNYDILNVIYFLDNVISRFKRSNYIGHDNELKYELDEIRNVLKITHTYKSPSDKSRSIFRVYYSENPIRVVLFDSCDGKKEIKHEKEFNSIDDLISYIKRYI